jgi:hypothetical protein
MLRAQRRYAAHGVLQSREHSDSHGLAVVNDTDSRAGRIRSWSRMRTVRLTLFRLQC